MDAGRAVRRAPDGIFAESPEQTMRNVGQLSTEGMVETDRTHPAHHDPKEAGRLRVRKDNARATGRSPGPAPEPANREDRPELAAVWEASVRATHHFLAEAADILALKPLILNEYFAQVALFCCAGRMARRRLADERLEMLFVRPELRGRGLGGRLTRHAIATLGVREVDVNEQNPEALAFYRHLGFAVTGRSPEDDQDAPFPS